MAKANKLIPVVDGTAGTPIELTDSRIEITNPAANDLLQYDSTQQQFVNTPASSIVPSHRTVNHEQITDSSLGDANLHDGFYFPNAVQDYDGNWYGAVVIGDQVWLAENLRTTHYADGTAIANGGSSTSTSTAYYYNYADSMIPFEKRGLLYNYPAAINIIPTGWSLPTRSDYQKLTDYVSSQKRFIIDNDSSAIAKALASTSYWSASNVENAVGNNISLNNATGLNLVPSGYLINSLDGTLTYAILWTKTAKDAYNFYAFAIKYESSNTLESNYTSNRALTVRCVSDLTPIQFRDWYVNTYGTLQHNVLSSELSAGRDIAITPQSQYVPKGFEELEYIRSTGTEWLDTYVVLGRDNTVSIKIVAQGEGDKGLICGFDQDWGGSYLGDNGSKYYMTGLSPSDERNTSNSLLKATLSETWTSTSSQYTLSGYIDDVPNTVYTSPRMNNINSNILLFRANNWTTADSYWAGRIFECKIWKNGKLVRNFVPARRILDNVVGLYETVHEEFYTNRGTGTLRAGPIVAIGAKTIISYTGIEIPNLTNNSGKVLAVNGTETNVEWVTKVSQLNNLSDVEVKYTLEEFKKMPDVVTDYDGNSYGAVIIGNQVWMTENLRTTHYPDGTEIVNVSNSSSRYVPFYYNNETSDIPLEKRGLHYNWYSALHVTTNQTTTPTNLQGVAPEGWHIPTYDEYEALRSRLTSVFGNASIKAMVSKDTWTASTNANVPGNNPSTNDESMFGLVANGLYYFNDQQVKYQHSWGDFWVSTQENSSTGWSALTQHDSLTIYRTQSSKYNASAVRCIYNGTPEDFINKMNKQVLVYDSSKQAWVNKNVAEALPSMSGNSGKVLTVNNTEDNVEWKKLDSIEDLSNVEIDNTPVDFKYIPDAVTDYDGNSYGAVVIGNKVWMAENLRTTHYADGTAIALGTGNVYTPAYFNNTSSSIPLEKRGYLYNYFGVTKGTNGSSTNPSNFQGVAPNGWHVPSDAEFLETENYISAYLGGSQISSENDVFDGRFTDVAIAKSIASKDYWQSSDVSNAPGNNPNINNSCWLGLTPNGNAINGLYSYVGQRCYLWTCTSASNKYIRRSINYAYAGIYRYNTSDAVAGYNVRCVYNGTPQQFMDEMYSKLMDKQILVYDKEKNAFVNKNVAEALPSMSGNSGKVLAVNSGETGVEWVTQSGGGDAEVLYCTLTPSGSTYTCDTSVSDIVTAYQSGKVVLLKITTDFRIFTCVHARTLSGTTTINAFYTGGVTASNSGMTDASITLLRYVGSEWQLLNSWNIQQKLVGTQTTGQNLKTVNGNSLLGSGDLTIGGVTIYSGSTAPSPSTGSNGDIYIQTVS